MVILSIVAICVYCFYIKKSYANMGDLDFIQWNDVIYELSALLKTQPGSSIHAERLRTILSQIEYDRSYLTPRVKKEIAAIAKKYKYSELIPVV